MHCLRQFREAGELCRAALEFYEGRGLRRNTAITLRTMALAESALGIHRLALEHLDQARGIFAEDGLLLDETMTHNCLGEVYARTADRTAARKHFRLAQKLGVRSGSTYEQARALRGLAELALRGGRPEQAELLGRQAERLYSGHVPVRHRAPRSRRPLDDMGAGE
jgi:tetratricopeptide (TPR) repeat protein